ncbi:hypothetical protein HHK36_018492 [Tetracentron sinense]|uniref:Uncharacterized protein n=1 Tax=Tetracentron sinense TaxID=13715 RepID=A0A835DDL1_TETSI|nr:hypothetical protein HHK36_018492 [Tetracentron sinense]
MTLYIAREASKVWRRISKEVSIEILLLAEKWKFLLAGIIFQVGNGGATVSEERSNNGESATGISVGVIISRDVGDDWVSIGCSSTVGREETNNGDGDVDWISNAPLINNVHVRVSKLLCHISSLVARNLVENRATSSPFGLKAYNPPHLLSAGITR